jgi:hypothetical protein
MAAMHGGRDIGQRFEKVGAGRHPITAGHPMAMCMSTVTGITLWLAAA